jgi:ABC-type sugar transport system substrate-binding protein
MSKILRRGSNFVVADPHTGGNADNYQNKRVAGKAICKTMKTKGEQTGLLRQCGQS